MPDVRTSLRPAFYFAQDDCQRGRSADITQKRGPPPKQMLRWGKGGSGLRSSLGVMPQGERVEPHPGTPWKRMLPWGEGALPAAAPKTTSKKGTPSKRMLRWGKERQARSSLPAARTLVSAQSAKIQMCVGRSSQASSLRLKPERQSAESTPQSAPKRGPHGSIRFHGEKERARHS